MPVVQGSSAKVSIRFTDNLQSSLFIGTGKKFYSDLLGIAEAP